MGLDVPARPGDVELRQRRIVGTGPGDQDVIDRRGQIVEESSEALEVGRVESGRAPRAQLGRNAPEAIRIAGGQDHVGPLGPGEPSGLEADPRGAADHDHGLSGELPLIAHAPPLP